jgi:DNA topoisomerase-3
MITIYAEKPDVGNKIAAALDQITLSSGKIIKFKDLKANEKAVKAQQFKDGYLKINYLGEECYVTWGYGHLCELKQAVDYDADYKNWSKMPMPFIPSKYEVKVKDDVKKQFKLVSDLMKKSSLVINATDYDREGELIFAYLYDAAKISVPFKRAHFSSQTEEGLNEGFDKLLTAAEVKNITDAGRRCRACWFRKNGGQG